MFAGIHGQWDIKTLHEQKIVLAKGKGGWNLEAAMAYCKEFKRVVAPLTNGKWAMCSYSDDWELGVPELNNVISELSQWMEDNGRVYKVTLVTNPLVMKQINDIATLAQQNVMFVGDVDTAVKKLAEHGFHLEKEKIKTFIDAEYPINDPDGI